MPHENLAELTYSALDVIVETGNFIHAELGKVQNQDIEVKALNSLVSYVDKMAEAQLVTELSKLVPESTFLTEEETIDTQPGEFQWIIDPLDGTTNFLHQIPFFAISVALQRREQTVVGIIYEVTRKERFYAWKEGGAWLNGRPIKVSDTSTIQESLMATGFPYYDYSYIQSYFEVLEYLMLNTRGIRRLGAAALDLAYVACGRFDGFFEYGLSPWDVAAGAFLIQEAGGIVSDFDGKDNYIYGGQVIASNKGISSELGPLVIRAFSKTKPR